MSLFLNATEYSKEGVPRRDHDHDDSDDHLSEHSQCATNRHRATDGDRALVTALLEAVGEVAWLDDEALIDAATAVSGSGPAYVFLLAEALAPRA